VIELERRKACVCGSVFVFHHVLTQGGHQELQSVFPWAVTTNGDNGVTPLSASQPAPTGGEDASSTSSTTPASLKVNGNNPAHWPLNQIWNDNLGALFSHDGISETVYSTSTVDVSAPCTTTIDYWAQIPGAPWLHATRTVIVSAPANDNAPITPSAASTTPPATNDNTPITPLSATGTEATSTAQ
jgi:hypothetical protein